MKNTYVTRDGQKQDYQRNFNWIGTSKCSICKEYASVVNVVGNGTRVCGRCKPDLYLMTGQLEKERWMKTGRR